MRFAKKAAVEEHAIYRRRIWAADDGLHRVSEIERKLEGGSIVFYAEKVGHTMIGRAWDYLSKHKTREAAMKACLDDLNVKRGVGRYERLEV